MTTRRLKRSKPTIMAAFQDHNFEFTLRNLRAARDVLRMLGAPRAADAVARAIKSTEGASNHARHRVAGGAA